MKGSLLFFYIIHSDQTGYKFTGLVYLMPGLVYKLSTQIGKTLLLSHSNPKTDKRMRIILLSAFALFLLLPENIQAQVTVKTGYISSSRYKDENGQYPGKGGYVLCGRERQYSRITENE